MVGGEKAPGTSGAGPAAASGPPSLSPDLGRDQLYKAGLRGAVREVRSAPPAPGVPEIS